MVADYTVDFGSREFTVTISSASQDEIANTLAGYAGAYNKRSGQGILKESLMLNRDHQHDYVVAVARLLADFIYAHVELLRRASLNEMYLAATSSKTGEDLRRRILEYLEHSEFDERLAEVLISQEDGLDRLQPVLDEIVSPDEAGHLRGSVGRMLTSYPDVPGLLLLRAVTEPLSRDVDWQVVEQSLLAALEFATAQYSLEIEDLAQACGQLISAASSRPTAAKRMLDVMLGSHVAERRFLRSLAEVLPLEYAYRPAELLNQGLAGRVVQAITGGES